ncbi:MAG: hypothetical protein ACXWM7_07260 [Parachlamydiaceae bacterium]
MVKIITIGALISILALTLASSPAFACSQPSKITIVVVRGDLVTTIDGDSLPMSLEIKALEYNKAMVGTGIIEDPACGKSIIAVAGSIKGTSLTLTGYVVKGIDLPELKGTKVKLVADCKSGNMVFTFGPISKGLPLSGMSFDFTGQGKIWN